MAYIKNQVMSDKIIFENIETIILDVQKTKTLTIDLNRVTSLSYKDIEELKNKYGSNELFLKILNSADEKWRIIKKNVESVEIFYEIVWNRTHLELMFLSRYYAQELTNPIQFEQLMLNKTSFESWWNDIVKHNLLIKLKKFYMKAAEAYAKISPIDIFEYDVEIMSKDVIKSIEESYLIDIKNYLEYEWNNSKKHYNEIFKKTQELKRKTILFE